MISFFGENKQTDVRFKWTDDVKFKITIIPIFETVLKMKYSYGICSGD